MKKGFILCTMLLSMIFSLQAQSLTELYKELRDDMYNQATTSPDIQKQIDRALDKVDAAGFDEADTLQWKAKLDYISARVYMEADMADKKDFEKFRSKDAEVRFERAYDALGAFLEIKEDSDVLTLRADILGQLCLLKGTSFTMANGLNIRKMTDRALELNPENAKALVLAGNDRVYTPKIFGGKPRDGIALFEQAENMPNAEKDDLFNIYSGIGVAWQKLKNKDLARFWMNKALTIYPENIYIQRMMAEI
ncbi:MULTISPECIES: hypothetical protein [unclassified Oceanispirochaeta]|uniref:hypothetical protein n=1 Tax=unclassified Oceanispirochaeta TaxID=2635722 RepID=UPI000E094D2A|nr:MULTISPECIES: hypothetical protein [unclassified Oceanispirochaeta]MBF9016043.1 hypothetical protein [Oceanispirochaeta sp. M2]NPD72506.1 hypothetical protein [Oceanispirochaeta sp. M1]RDG31964.1 hypothetical protein DV872_10375 [Oceanispirochaeta sp. M1]